MEWLLNSFRYLKEKQILKLSKSTLKDIIQLLKKKSRGGKKKSNSQRGNALIFNLNTHVHNFEFLKHGVRPEIFCCEYSRSQFGAIKPIPGLVSSLHFHFRACSGLQEGGKQRTDGLNLLTQTSSGQNHFQPSQKGIHLIFFE